jgi:hypothetical protein
MSDPTTISSPLRRPSDDEEVFCWDCKHVNESGYRCMASPIEPEWNYQTGQRKNESYKLCVDVNRKGCCIKHSKGDES